MLVHSQLYSGMWGQLSSLLKAGVPMPPVIAEPGHAARLLASPLAPASVPNPLLEDSGSQQGLP